MLHYGDIHYVMLMQLCHSNVITLCYITITLLHDIKKKYSCQMSHIYELQ